MKIIKFAHDFPKLGDDFFSTIRSPPKQVRSGQVVLIKSPKHEFKAIVISRRTEYVKDIDTDDLNNDTGTQSREEALMVLRKFYPDLDEDSLVQVLWLIPDRRDNE